jgi:hypothetical protein
MEELIKKLKKTTPQEKETILRDYIHMCYSIHFFAPLLFKSEERASGIARRTPKRKPTTLHNPNTPFLSIKLLRKHLNSNLLSFIFIIPYFF